MAIVEPQSPRAHTKAPFQSAQPVVEFWDTATQPNEWKPFVNGRMYCDKLTMRTFSQGISEAMLRYECGEIGFEAQPGFSPVSTLNLDRTWIRVRFTTDDSPGVDIDWAGIVVSTQEVNRAGDDVDVDLFPPITQVFRAVGMEWLLSRKQIARSDVGALNRIRYGLTFNAHSDAKIGRATVKGNRSRPWGTFADDSRGVEIWTGQQIIEYFEKFRYFPEDVEKWQWQMENLSYAKWVKPVIPCHGRSLFDVLRSIATPSRALDSSILYDAGGTTESFGTFTYRIHSMLSTQTRLPSGSTIPAGDIVNIDQFSHRGGYTTKTTDSSQRYDEVVVIGARTGAIASFSKKDKSLVNGWKKEDQEGYKLGDPNAAAITDESAFRDAHDRFRRQKYPYVFTEFVVPIGSRWDGKVGDGEGNNRKDAFGQRQDLYPTGMRFFSYVPLKVGWDYQSVEPEATLSAPDIDEFRKPFVVFKMAADKWEYGHELSNVWDETVDPNGFDFSCHVHPLERRLGVSVTPPVPHLIAASVTDPIDPDTSDRQPVLDFEDMIITAYTQSHRFAEGRYPKLALALPQHVHYLRVGETAFLDYMPAGTVVDVRGGKLIRSTRRMYVRDDRKYLEDIAQMAWQWYGINHTSSQIGFRQITGGALPGQLIGTFDELPINALVSSVIYDFQDQSTEIYTHFAEPNFAELAR